MTSGVAARGMALDGLPYSRVRGEKGLMLTMDITYSADRELPVVQGRCVDLDQNLLWADLVSRECRIWLVVEGRDALLGGV